MLIYFPSRVKFFSWKHFLRVAVCLISLYCVMICSLLAFEDQLVFRPIRADQQWQPPSSGCDVHDVYFTLNDGTRIHGWWCPGKDARRVVLYCHGCGRNLSRIRAAHPLKLMQWHEQIDASFLVFDYPGYGKSEGSPSETGCYAAAQAAYDWLHSQKTTPDHIIIYGRSLGTSVAVDLASRNKHQALVLVAPFTSIPDVAESCYYLLPARLLMRNRFDSLSKIKSCRKPILIFHGTHDRRVPFVLGKRLFESANEPKRFIQVDGASHGSSVVINFFPELKRFLAEMTDS